MTISTPVPPAVEPTETPAAFVVRTELGVDKAWRAWNDLEVKPRMSRKQFRDAVAQNPAALYESE